ncbi:hypothetical protein JL2886_03202 [Phaeobacter gallaeciensis]|uniref:Uncharacterized protein n=1 Tax=Phaeobacter gallaeciensis TaxID=60890 RepID=A0A1B0ZV98_9RHOB|nr:hypothetical protein JL2886_03202 [Phaeobacter gallaeciensis]
MSVNGARVCGSLLQGVKLSCLGVNSWPGGAENYNKTDANSFQ